ncbi:hypothetical protein pb186bvf_016324 [Paramecium bursaria]
MELVRMIILFYHNQLFLLDAFTQNLKILVSQQKKQIKIYINRIQRFLMKNFFSLF